jgi:hypothetical protein
MAGVSGPDGYQPRTGDLCDTIYRQFDFTLDDLVDLLLNCRLSISRLLVPRPIIACAAEEVWRTCVDRMPTALALVSQFA